MDATRLYHVWFSTQGRKEALQGEVAADVRRALAETARVANIDVLELAAETDHVHMLIRITEGQTLPSVLHRLKGATARSIFLKYPELRIDMGTNAFWQKGYGWRKLTTDEEPAIRQYIRTQHLRPLRHDGEAAGFNPQIGNKQKHGSNDRRRLGEVGEGLAAAHLEAKGYDIIATNVRLPQGEIDIVAKRNGVTVLVEVRARRGTRMGDGAESINQRKADRLRQLIASYASLHELSGDVRIDVVSVDMTDEGRLVGLRHFENAVEGRAD